MRMEQQRASQARLGATVQPIDLDALQEAIEGRHKLLQSPFLAVLDTEFFRSAFRSMLRYPGAPPKSLRVAQEGRIKLFIGEQTVWQLIGKLEVWAIDFGVTRSQMEEFLMEWAPWMWVVKLPEVSSDPRADIVAKRDFTDAPAARLVALLAPCILLSRDKDFEAFEIADPSNPLVAIEMTVVLENLTVQVRAIVMIPVVPISGAAAALGWVGKKTGINPWIIGAAILGLFFIGYRRMEPERRTEVRKLAGQLGTHYMEQLAAAQQAQRQAIADLEHRIVPRSMVKDRGEVALRELARSDGPMSAQRLWELLDPEKRQSVVAVRQLVRQHESTWKCRGNGQWSFGILLDEYLEVTIRV